MVEEYDEVSCDKCHSKEGIQEHHVLLSFMRDNQNIKEGQRIDLCKKCHDIIHKMLIKFVWEYVDKQEECKEAIKKFTKKWIS